MSMFLNPSLEELVQRAARTSARRRPEVAPMGGLPPPGRLDRFIGGLPSFGVEDPELRREAFKTAMMRIGGATLAGASRGEGLAALGPAMAEGLPAYRESLLGAADERRRQEGFDLDKQEATSRAQYYEEQNRLKREELEDKRKAAEALMARHRAALDRLTPEVRARLEPFVGTPKFEDRLFEVTEPEEPGYDPNTDPQILRAEEMRRRRLGVYRPDDEEEGGEEPLTLKQKFDLAHKFAVEDFDEKQAAMERMGKKAPKVLHVDTIRQGREEYLRRFESEGVEAVAQEREAAPAAPVAPAPIPPMPADFATDPRGRALIERAAQRGLTPQQAWELFYRELEKEQVP